MTTDINELAQSLEAAAEKALQGKWEYEANAIWNTDENGWVQHMASVESGDDVSDGEHNSNMQFITTATPANVLTIIDALSESQSQAENHSNCADNTINLAIEWQVRCKDTEVRLDAAQMRVVELVEALEKAQSANVAQDDHINQQQDRIEQLEKGHQEAAKQIISWRRLAKQNIAEREKDIAELEAARQRIAELESRTVIVKQFDEFQICHYGATEDYAKGYIDCQNNYNKALSAAGIQIQGGE